ncbi:elongation factor 1-alpha, partial [Leishmania donovani]
MWPAPLAAQWRRVFCSACECAFLLPYGPRTGDSDHTAP